MGRLDITEHIFEEMRYILSVRKRKSIYRKGFKSSAVALINHLYDGEYYLLFTLRSDKVKHHQGQISFPGGARDANERLVDCAIRETKEELDIELRKDELLGKIDDILTISRFRVTPFVFFINKRDILEGICPNDEIAEVLNIPLNFLLGYVPRVEDVKYGRLKIKQYFYDYKNYTIWGATGRILKQYLDLLSMVIFKECGGKN
ncbi:MAG: CoA pyrophosphatase [Deltaproteobacteria bacterium]|nr:CoA pyrophosphatase [Deltaproteobacteria bacterium]